MPLNPVPNYPTSLDALPDPTGATWMDDDGFEQDLLLQKHNAILEALEQKVGTGTTTAAVGTILRGIGPGSSAFGALQASDVAAGVIARRNRLINPYFAVAVRPAAAGHNQYAHDRWRLLLGATNAATATGVSGSVPSDGSGYAAQLTVGSAPNNKFGYFEVLEAADIWDLRGLAVSLMATLAATAGIADVRMAVLAWTGTPDAVSASPIATWNAQGTPPTLAANWAYLGTPANLGATTTPGTFKVENLPVPAGAANLGVLIWVEDTSTTTTTDALTINQVQLERGATSSAWDRRPIADERMLCRRYARHVGAGLQGTAYTSGATGILLAVPLDPPMRAAPSAALTTSTVTGINAGAGGYGAFTTTALSVGSTNLVAGGGQVSLGANYAATPANGQALVAQVDFLLLTAEL